MKTIKINYADNIPDNFTGITEYPSGNKYWFLNGAQHREDGPAIEFASGVKYWYLDDKHYLEDKYKTEMAIRSSTLGRLILKDKYFKLEA